MNLCVDGLLGSTTVLVLNEDNVRCARFRKVAQVPTHRLTAGVQARKVFDSPFLRRSSPPWRGPLSNCALPLPLVRDVCCVDFHAGGDYFHLPLIPHACINIFLDCLRQSSLSTLLNWFGGALYSFYALLGKASITCKNGVLLTLAW